MFKGGMGGMLKQAQKMQENMQKAQAELEAAETTGSSGAGLVSIVMNGKFEAKSIKLDNSLMNEDKEIIEDLVVAAINDAVAKINAASSEKMSAMTAGLQLPPGMKLPF